MGQRVPQLAIFDDQLTRRDQPPMDDHARIIAFVLVELTLHASSRVASALIAWKTGVQMGVIGCV